MRPASWLCLVALVASACGGGTTNPPPPPLSISPATVSVPPRGTQTFTASGGGTQQEIFALVTNASGGRIDPTTGVYVAGSLGNVTDVVRVSEPGSQAAEATIAVTSGVTLSTSTPTTPPRGALTFTASGGSGTYAFSFAANSSGGTIDAASGAYVAGAVGSVMDVVQVIDSLGNAATLDIAVTAGLTLNHGGRSLVPGGTTLPPFTVTGGSGTGYVWTLTPDANATPSATLTIANGAATYRAGAVTSALDLLTVTDSLGNTTSVRIGVGDVLAGTVRYTGRRTGRTYVVLRDAASFAIVDQGNAIAGTSLAAPGQFALRGVGTRGTAPWRVDAFVDTQGVGQLTAAADPVGSVTLTSLLNTTLTQLTGPIANPLITLADPALGGLSAPVGVTVFTGDRLAGVNWKRVVGADGRDLADHYVVTCDTTGANAQRVATVTVPHGDRAFFPTLTNGVEYAFTVTAVQGNATVASLPVLATVDAAAGAHTVTGLVSFPAAALPGTLVVALQGAAGPPIGGAVLAPVSPQSFSIAVPDGNYNIISFVDRGADGWLAPTDPFVGGGDLPGPQVTVAGADANTGTITIPTTGVKLELAWRNVTGASWDVLLGVASNLRRPVAVVAKLGAAPELTAPIDMGLSSTNFPQGGRFDVTIRTSTQPTTADQYTFDVFYDDGLAPATETVSGNLIAAIL